MARKRSYFAKANQGNVAGTFFNNMAASHQKREREQKAADKARIRQREREQKRINRELEKASAQEEKQKARLKKEKNKDEKIFNQFLTRSELLCEKYKLYPTVAYDIATQALKAGITVAKIDTDLMVIRLKKFNKKSISYFLIDEETSENLHPSLTEEFLNDIVRNKKENSYIDIKKSETYNLLKEKSQFLFEKEKQIKGIESELNNILSESIIRVEDFESFQSHIMDNNIPENEIRKSILFKTLTQKRIDYVADLEKRLQRFML